MASTQCLFSIATLASLVGLLPSCPRQSASLASGSEPLVIRAGGTYTGSYRSTDSSVPCILIETDEPVTLRGCLLFGAGDLIRATQGNAQLTVVNCRGYGLPPSADNTRPGRFLEVNSAQSVLIEHNYFEQTSGITIYQWGGNGTARQTLTVRYNSAKNIDGRYRNGGTYPAQFLQANGVHNLAGCEIAWNQIINEPNKSLVEDNISLYNSSGTPRSPVLLHDNYIQGAYPYPANATAYTGSGITLDGSAQSAIGSTAFIEAYNNQVVSTGNAAMNIASGHDSHFHNNRIVTSGLLPDGSRLPTSWAAVAIFNHYEQPRAVFFNNTIRDNTIGFVHWGSANPFANRQDASPGACTACTGTVHLPNPITLQTEQAEWLRWQQKLHRQGASVGPVRTLPARRPPAITKAQ